jgi:hypothetical protein
MRWCLEKSGKYTTKSMYRALSHRGVVNIQMRKIWGVKAANEDENIHVASLSGQVANWGDAEEEKMERQHVLCCLRCAGIRRSPFFSPVSWLNPSGHVSKRPWDGTELLIVC